MASLERRYRIIFCYGGKRFNHSLGKMPEREARSCLDRLEESLRFVERGLFDVPPDADLGTFLVSGGKLNGKPVIEKSASLAEFFQRYQKERPEGGKEAVTRSIEDIHIIRASLYAPLRMLLYENEEGKTCLDYDKPSSLFGQFGNGELTAVATMLDSELEALIAMRESP